MTPCQKRLTPITDRMAGDMRIRNLAQATIDAYTYHVGRFADFIQRPIRNATAEDVRNFQLYLVEEKKVGWSSFNQAVCGLRFLYTTTLPKPWPIASIPFGKRPRRLTEKYQVRPLHDCLTAPGCQLARLSTLDTCIGFHALPRREPLCSCWKEA